MPKGKKTSKPVAAKKNTGKVKPPEVGTPPTGTGTPPAVEPPKADKAQKAVTVRPWGELKLDVREKLTDLLGKSPAGMSQGDLDFLKARREYLNREQREYYGVDE